ncbi:MULTISPECIES: hypothetical protein [unclassified Ensifer]|uniref:hypothetical protein n=1 Tax=unclassified Ensifer TaxID=2633371 RepID=UPI0013747A64|nr:MULTISPECIES: hypothetical protein [unclassified Ensifer]
MATKSRTDEEKNVVTAGIAVLSVLLAITSQFSCSWCGQTIQLLPNLLAIGRITVI